MIHFPPPMHSDPGKCLQVSLKRLKGRFRGYFSDFIIRSFLKFISHSFTQEAPDLRTISPGNQVKGLDLLSWLFKSAFYLQGSEFLQLHSSRNALVGCSSILVLGTLWAISHQQRSLRSKHSDMPSGHLPMTETLPISPLADTCCCLASSIHNLNIHIKTKEAISWAAWVTFILALTVQTPLNFSWYELS